MSKEMTKQEAARITEIAFYKVEMWEMFSGVPREKIEEAKLKALAALEQQPLQGWIPVSERLPNKGGRYFIQQEGVFEYIGISEWCPYEGCWFDDVDEAKENELYTEFVIAWQPLPKPYKPKE